MKAILLLVFVFLFAGCAQDRFPAFPDNVKSLYAIDVDPETKEVSCGLFAIKSTVPFRTEFMGFVDLERCQGMSGFRPDDMTQVLNWVDDTQSWAKDRRCKLK